MKMSLAHRFASWVNKRPGLRYRFYVVLILLIGSSYLFITRKEEKYLWMSLFWAGIAFREFERRGFYELVKAKDDEMERLKIKDQA